ncbi:hypothetical protein [Sphingomonas sp.]|uniref:hypothetical protein n=1 Tax=Sphingomonas sp. TaxID=28214 RepID=UPI002608EDE4|nr:hypothetical protein [Sphingomonas sp.]MDF2496115.1 hypothetical protein [Sphingomonas sp.]
MGKSSLIDALEFALTGTSSLFATGRLGVSWALGAPHVRGGEMKVSLVITEGRQTYELTPGQPADAPVEKWRATMADSGFVLRRHMLLSFVDARPRHRYDRLEPFLNLRQYLGLEAALQHAAARARMGSTTAETQLRVKEQSLRTILSLEEDQPIDEGTLLSRVNAALDDAALPQIANVAEVQTAAEAVRAELGDTAADGRLATLHALRGQVQRLGFASDLRLLLEEVALQVGNLKAELEDRVGPVITEFLMYGRNIVAELQPSECPLCEQDVAADQLIERLNGRISADQRVTAVRQALSSAVEAAQKGSRALASAMQQFATDWAACMQSDLPAAYGSTVALMHEMAALAATHVTADEARELADRLSATVSTHLPVIEAIENAITAADGGARRTKLHAAKSLLGSAIEDWPALQRARRTAKSTQTRVTLADRLYGHAIEARKATVQLLLDEVAALANTYYAELHPDERIANSRLVIRPKEDGSVNLSSDFYGKDSPPLLFYSESHLDTLGICYFLALRRREADDKPAFKLLLLDDVLHSVDSKHRARFVQLLKDHFHDHQLVVTTHDSIFYQMLRQTLGTAGYAYLSLMDWDVERGPLRGDPSTDLDRIIDPELRSTKSSEELAGAGGRLLEWMLREATEALEVAIPARFKRRHDIGTMWPALAKKLRSQRHFIAAHPTLAERVERTGWVRNEVGAHYNEPSATVDVHEVRAHASCLAELHAALTCQNCGSFVSKFGDHDWRCRCAKTAYSAASESKAASCE